MISISDMIRQQRGILSLPALKMSFLEAELYWAASVKDFVDNRNIVNTSTWSRCKINYHKTMFAHVIIESCRYQKIKEPVVPSKAAFHEVYAEHYIRAPNEDPLFNIEAAEQEYFEKLKNGQIYDIGTSYLVFAPNPIPESIQIYDVFLRYIPNRDTARVEGFSTHRPERAVSSKVRERSYDFLPTLTAQPT